jgi:hypothetical protein
MKIMKGKARRYISNNSEIQDETKIITSMRFCIYIIPWNKSKSWIVVVLFLCMKSDNLFVSLYYQPLIIHFSLSDVSIKSQLAAIL